LKPRGPLADEAAAKRNEKALEEKRRQYDEDLLAVMRSPVGRRFIWRLVDDTTGVFASSFTGNSETFFREGRRSVGLFVMNEIRRVAPTETVHMYQEQLTAQANEALRQKEAGLAVEE
jgi:hypothetical protein